MDNVNKTTLTLLPALKRLGACTAALDWVRANTDKAPSVLYESCPDSTWSEWLLGTLRIPYDRAEYERATAAARAEYQRATAPAWAEYRRATAPAWAEYERVRAAAYAEYERATAAAYAEYGRATAAAYAEYGRATAAAGAEYGRATAPAWAEYERVRAAALVGMVPWETVAAALASLSGVLS